MKIISTHIIFLGSCGCNLRENNIIHGKSCSWCNIDSLFSNGCYIKWYSTLPLCFIKYSVHSLECHHVIIHLDSNFLADLIFFIVHFNVFSWSTCKKNEMVGQVCKNLRKISSQNWLPIVIKDAVAGCSLKSWFRYKPHFRGEFHRSTRKIYGLPYAVSMQLFIEKEGRHSSPPSMYTLWINSLMIFKWVTSNHSMIGRRICYIF